MGGAIALSGIFPQGASGKKGALSQFNETGGQAQANGFCWAGQGFS
jgi:hypothetical protein